MIVGSVLATVLWGCLGAAGYAVVRIGDEPAAGPVGAPSAAPDVPAPAATGPLVVRQAVRTQNDLDRVCADRYYPSAPKVRGDGPHPVLISEGAPRSRRSPSLGVPEVPTAILVPCG